MLCVEIDFLQGSSFNTKIAMAKHLLDDAEGQEGQQTTSSAVPSLDSKVLSLGVVS